MKKFLIRLSYTVFPLWVFAVGAVVYYALAIAPNMQDDMGRLGKMPTRWYYEKPVDSIPQDTLFTSIKHLEELKKVHTDVLVCGDSFSQQMPYGYVNYLAHHGVDVVNAAPVRVIEMNPFQLAWDVMNLVEVDSTNAQTLIIESVERALETRILAVDFQNNALKELEESPKGSTGDWSIMEMKNWLSLRVKSLLFRMTGRKIPHLPVLQLPMSQALFSGTHGTDLYVYCDDVNTFSIEDSVSMKVKTNIDTFFVKAQEKHLNLIILVCPDKYDMYQEYIVKNPFPPKTVNEDFRRLVGDNPNVVIGKELLLQHLHAGEKDLYYWDDTHWSYKSAKIVADTLNERIRNHHPSPVF